MKSAARVDYDGPHESVECAYPGCTNRLRRAAFTDEPQFCSKEHRDGRSAASALERAALRVLNEARRSGSVTVKAREDLAEALGLPREAARGRWYGWHGGTGEERAEILARVYGDHDAD